MRALLFLSVVGAALYGLLLLSDQPLSEAQNVTANAQHHTPAVQSLGSWGPYLPAVLVERRAPLYGFEGAEHEPRNDAAHILEPKREPKAESLKPEDLRVAQVILPARVHSTPSMSSPTAHFFNPGTKLQVLNQENGWVELIDAAAQERGWVIDSYVYSNKGPLTQTATPSQDKLSTPKATTPVVLASKQRSRPAKAAPQKIRKFVPKVERSRERTVVSDERPRRLGLFGRRFAIFDNAR
jgi:hypothetical protein